jgi:hypothetical protein
MIHCRPCQPRSSIHLASCLFEGGQWFCAADCRHHVIVDVDAKPAKKLGRPKADKTKVQLCIRIDEDILERFRASGKGWQTRLQDILKIHAPRPRKAGRK